MSRPGADPGPRRRRDRVLLLCGAVAVVAIVVGLLASLAAPSAPAGPTHPGEAAPAVALDDVEDVRDHVGSTVVADGVEVEDVPADEGFWVETAGDRAWVQVDTAGESPFVVEPGRRISFTGQVVAHDPDFARQPEFPAADADELADAGAHVEVDVADVRLVG